MESRRYESLQSVSATWKSALRVRCIVEVRLFLLKALVCLDRVFGYLLAPTIYNFSTYMDHFKSMPGCLHRQHLHNATD